MAFPLPALILLAQAPAPAPKPAEPPRAALTAAEAGSVEAIMTSLYGFISGPAGQKRDVAKVRALFHPDCRFIVTGNGPKGPGFRVFTVEQFLERAVPQWEQGFYEQEAHRDVQRWGNMAAVWTRYESRHEAAGAPFMRGINSLQLQWDGARWWVMSIQFQNEDEAAKLP
jgi:ketosteroid isomerase-like protein